MDIPSPVTIQSRGINGNIRGDAIVEEQHIDELATTDHPVEQGATITDHAYKLPSLLHLTYVWSPNGQQNKGHDPVFLKTIYQQLLQLQIDRALVTVVTGKRSYKNMLLMSAMVTTDKQSENVLYVKVTCKEILIATTQVLQLTDAAVQTLPNKTATTVNQGLVNMQPGNNFNGTGVTP